MSDSLLPQELQHVWHPCPSLSPRVCSNSCPLSHWCHPVILSSVTFFPSYPQSFPSSWSFPKSQLFASGTQSIRASASTSVLPMNIHSWLPLGSTALISLQSKGLSRFHKKFPRFPEWLLEIACVCVCVCVCVCMKERDLKCLLSF